MKSRLKTFGDFILLKESVNDIEATLPDKWKKLQDLGFYDASTLRIKANGNILLKNDKFNYYPEGIVLQPNSGYVRDKGTKSGFLRKNYTLDQMADYLINRFGKYEGESSSIGISPEMTIFLKNLSSSKVTRNPETGRFDFSGSVELYDFNLEKLIKFGIKLGVIEKNFSYHGGSEYKNPGPLSPEDLKFFPTQVKGEFELRSCNLIGFSDLRAIPTKMGNGLSIHSVKNLKSLSGATLNSGKKTEIKIYSCPDLESLGEDLPKEVETLQIDIKRKELSGFKLFSLNGCPKIVHESFSVKGTGIGTLKGGPEEVRGKKYEVDENRSLRSLEGFPLGFEGEFSSDVISCWFSLEDRIRIINDGTYFGFSWWGDERTGPEKASPEQIQFVVTSFSLGDLQKLVDENPEKMAVVLKGDIKNPYFKGLKWPESLKGEVDLLSDLDGIGL